MIRRLTIKPSVETAMTVSRRAVRSDHLVYIICTPKTQRYPLKRSRIVYIGTTQKGVHRVASSIAHKAIDFLKKRQGIKWLDVYLTTCPRRPGIQTWLRLERDLLVAFKLEHGLAPLANRSGRNYTPDRLSGLFKYQRLVKVLAIYGKEGRGRRRKVKRKELGARSK